ncbi:MAG: heparan-alpha-glucosaminide N-acetyltransferase domain-containing protein [Candidatus Hermodarchaeota archaeon]
MKRIKSIDTIRGICMWIMIYGHIIFWWLRPEDAWLVNWLFAFLQPMGANGFLLVSGISAALAYKNSQAKLKVSNKFNFKIIKNVYFIRAMFILIIGIIFNIFAATMYGGNIYDIWSWSVLQTIGISLILVWPFLKTSKFFRIILGVSFILANHILLGVLLPYKGEFTLFGIFYHLLFNPSDQYIILTYFGIFILGSAIGDIIFDINVIDDEYKRKFLFKKNFLFHTFLAGIIITIFGILFQFPQFLGKNTISSVFYSLGIILATLSGLMAIEMLEKVKTKKSYRFFFFYSYYSFTIYLAHNLLFFLFYKQLNATLTIWIAIIIGNVLLGFLFRATYKTLGPKASLKVGISVISFKLAFKWSKQKFKSPKEKT